MVVRNRRRGLSLPIMLAMGAASFVLPMLMGGGGGGLGGITEKLGSLFGGGGKAASGAQGASAGSRDAGEGPGLLPPLPELTVRQGVPRAPQATSAPVARAPEPARLPMAAAPVAITPLAVAPVRTVPSAKELFPQVAMEVPEADAVSVTASDVRALERVRSQAYLALQQALRDGDRASIRAARTALDTAQRDLDRARGGTAH